MSFIRKYIKKSLDKQIFRMPCLACASFYVVLFVFHFNILFIHVLYILLIEGPSWSWSYASWIYNYLYNQCLSPLTLWGRIPLKRGVLDTTLCYKFVSDLRQVCGFLWILRFSPPIKLTATIWLLYCWKWR